jgi:hypothetical protein
MKEIWLLEDLHAAEAVRPLPIGGYTAPSCQNRLELYFDMIL